MPPSRRHLHRLLVSTHLAALGALTAFAGCQTTPDICDTPCPTLNLWTFCKEHPASCLVEGQPLPTEPGQVTLQIPVNETVTFDVSQAGFEAGEILLWVFVVSGQWSLVVDHFEIRLDGVDASEDDAAPSIYEFGGHHGSPKTLEFAWYGDGAPEIRVNLTFEDGACIQRAADARCPGWDK